MRRRILCVTTLVLLATFASPSPAIEPPASQALEWEPYTGRTAQRGQIEGQVARITVPENRDRPDGPKIEIAFVRYRSSNPEAGPPIFYLAGGPGGSGVSRASFFATHPALDLLAHGDVIGVDQRGVGLSKPNLFEPEFTYDLPADRAITAKDLIEAYGGAVSECAAYWKKQGVDLASYSTAESADDLDAVRRALGVDKIAIYGESYGSHLALAYLRSHGKHVARAVLSRCEGPDHTWKYPSTVQRCLERLSTLVAADATVGEAMPDLAGTVKQLLDKLDKEPKTLTLRDDRKVHIGKFDLQLILSQFLGGSREMQTIPAAMHQLSQGDWSLLANIVDRYRGDRITGAMPIWMDMASGATAGRLARIEREARDPKNILGDAINFPYHPALRSRCGNPDLGDAFRGPLRCDAPVLMVSGDLDAKTPPQNVDDIVGGLPNGIHVIATNTAHDSRELESREYRNLLRTFLGGGKVESKTIELPPLRFFPVDTDMTGGR